MEEAEGSDRARRCLTPCSGWHGCSMYVQRYLSIVELSRTIIALS